MKLASILYKRYTGIAVLVTVAALLLVPFQVSAAPAIEVVASGLNNPRGLAMAFDGTLYVAEAGTGGAGPCVDGPEGEVCFGLSGSVTQIKNGLQERIVTGLPSLADPDGFSATGPVDILPTRGTALDIMVGLGAPPEAREIFGEDGSALGHIVKATPLENVLMVDIAAYEADVNPDGTEIDSNPYSFTRGRINWYVVDAGGNDLLHVLPNGRIETLAVFPERMVPAPPFLGLPPGAMIPMESVPDSVAVGPDDAIYVSELTGFPFPVGEANIYRVTPGSEPEVFASGFTNIIDIAFGPDGSLFVLELTSSGLLSNDLSGALHRVDSDGNITTILNQGLVAPGGLVIGHDGSIYISNFSIFPGAGQVIRVAGAAIEGYNQVGENAGLAARAYMPVLTK